MHAEIDSHSSWYADVNSFSELDDQVENGPTYNFEYSTREAYGGSITEWGPNDPLNATWWHLVTEGELEQGFFQTTLCDY